MVKCLLKTLPINFNVGVMEKVHNKEKIKIRYFVIGFFAFFILGVFSTVPFFGSFLSPQDKIEKSDVIVVISGGDTTERTAEGIELLKEGYAPYILFSGAARTGKVSNAEMMRNYAIKQGIAKDKIFIEEESTSTYENALFSKKILEENNFKEIILVTSPYHQRRAYMNFSYILGKDYKILNNPSFDSSWSKDSWWKNRKNLNTTIEELSGVIYLTITKKYGKELR